MFPLGLKKKDQVVQPKMGSFLLKTLKTTNGKGNRFFEKWFLKLWRNYFHWKQEVNSSISYSPITLLRVKSKSGCILQECFHGNPYITRGGMLRRVLDIPYG